MATIFFVLTVPASILWAVNGYTQAWQPDLSTTRTTRCLLLLGVVAVILMTLGCAADPCQQMSPTLAHHE